MFCNKLTDKRYEFIKKIKEDNGKDYKDDLIDYCQQIVSDYICMGSYKTMKGAEDKYKIGKCVLNMVSKTKKPILIFKNYFKRSDNGGKFNFLACLDGSEKSFKSLSTINALKKDTDKIYALHVIEEYSKLDYIKQKFDETNNNLNLKAELILIEKNIDQLTKTIVLQYINDNGSFLVDFAVFGNNGLTAEKSQNYFMGKTATKILMRSKANLITIP